MVSGPNKTIAAGRKKWGRSKEQADRLKASRDRRFESSPHKDIMNRVSRGELTPQQGAEIVKKLMSEDTPAVNAAGDGSAVAGLDRNPPGPSRRMKKLREVVRRKR